MLDVSSCLWPKQFTLDHCETLEWPVSRWVIWHLSTQDTLWRCKKRYELLFIIQKDNYILDILRMIGILSSASNIVQENKIWLCHEQKTQLTKERKLILARVSRCQNNSITRALLRRAMTRSFDVLFDLRLNKRLSKQKWGWWFETPLHSLWRHCNDSLIGSCSVPIHYLNLCRLIKNGALGINLSKSWIEILNFSVSQMGLKMSQGLHQPSHTRHSHHVGSGGVCVMSTGGCALSVTRDHSLGWVWRMWKMSPAEWQPYVFQASSRFNQQV